VPGGITGPLCSWPADRADASLNAVSSDMNFWKQIVFLEHFNYIFAYMFTYQIIA
jgi:hypothetical protein